MRHIAVLLIAGVALLSGCNSSLSPGQSTPIAEVPRTTPEADTDSSPGPAATGEDTGPWPIATIPRTVASPSHPPIPTQPLELTALPTTPPQSGKPTQTPAPGEAPRVGALAPSFELLDVRTGQPLSLASLRGKPVFLNFWGTWCPPCRAEMPEIQKMYQKYQGQVEIIGISLGPRDKPDMAKSFVDERGYSWTFVHDTDSGVGMRYNAFNIPISYFIDKDGIIRAAHIGAMSYEQMESYLRRVSGPAK